MFRTQRLGLDAHAYIRWKASMQSTFWRMLAETAPLDSGSALTYVPPATALADLKFFEWHLHSRQDLEQRKVDYEYKTREAAVLFEFLQRSPDHLLVFYGPTVPPGKVVPRIEGPIFTCYHTLFYLENRQAVAVTETYLLALGDISLSNLALSLANWIEQWPFLCALSSFRDAAGLLTAPERELSGDTLRELAHNTQAVMIGAYGGDARILWWRDAPEET